MTLDWLWIPLGFLFAVGVCSMGFAMWGLWRIVSLSARKEASDG